MVIKDSYIYLFLNDMFQAINGYTSGYKLVYAFCLYHFEPFGFSPHFRFIRLDSHIIPENMMMAMSTPNASHDGQCAKYCMFAPILE